MSLVVVIGPDGAGKTTLVWQIAERLGHEPVKFTQHSRYPDYIARLASNMPLHEVWDRFFLDEYIYQPVVRPDQPLIFSLKERDNLTLLFYARQPLVVYCSEVLRKTDGYVTQDQNRQISRLYEKWADKLRMVVPVVNYRAGIDPVEDVFSAVTRDLAPDWWAPMWEAGYGGIGSRHPRVMLLAENLGPSNFNHLPFEAGPSGLFLSRVLGLAKIPLKDVFITNTIKTGLMEHDLKLLREEVGRLGSPPVLMLGAVARDNAGPVLREMGIRTAQVLHPSAWCRFHKDEPESRYVSMFKERYESLLS